MIMNMEPKTFEKPPMTVEEAHTAIAEIRQEVAAMGANDREFDSLDQVLAKLDAEALEPEEAVKEARGVLESKQDYH